MARDTVSRSPSPALLAVPPLLFYLVVVLFCRNAPYFDDYFAILEPLVRIARDSTASIVFEALVSQGNQHRNIVVHVFALVNWLIAGTVSFWLLNLIGNLFLILGVYAMYRAIRDPLGEARKGTGADYLLLTVLVCLVFNFTYFRLLSFPMAAVAVIGVYCFAIFGFYLVFKGNLWGGVFFLLVAAASQANGLIGLPLAAFFLAVERQWRRALVVALIGVVVIALYFSNYDFHATMSPLVEKNGGAAQAAATPLWTRAAYFLVQVGSLVTLNNRAMNLPAAFLAVPAVTGVALITAHAWLLGAGHLKRRRAISAFLLFLLAAMAALSLVRIGTDYNEWVPVRYKLASCLYAAGILGTLAVVAGERGAWPRWSMRALYGASVLVWLGSLVFLIPHIAHYKAFSAPLATETWYTPQQAEAAAQVLSEAARLGIYSW